MSATGAAMETSELNTPLRFHEEMSVVDEVKIDLTKQD